MKKLLTLCFIEKDDKILLGMKKRGFGAGRWNGFGGKVEIGETIPQSAIREVFEEVGIKVLLLEPAGILNFSFTDKADILEVSVFRVQKYEGEPKETEEMKPEWFSKENIPYEKMWSDDKYWLPLFLEHKKIQGTFLLDKNDQVIEKKVEIIS